MKQNVSYPKVIIHRLGAPSVSTMPRAARTVWLRLLRLVLLVFAAESLHAGTHTWSGAGANTLWSNVGNWSAGGAPVPGESNVVLIFPSNATGFTSTVNVNNLSVDRMEFSKPPLAGSIYTFPNGGTPLTLTGVAGDNIWLKDNVSVIWQPNLTLQNTCRVNLALTNGLPSNFDIQGIVAGNGGLVKQGGGYLEFSTGGSANTFLGTMRVEAGGVLLNKIVGTPCFGGNLEIAGGSVRVGRSHQIPDTAAITIGFGLLKLEADVGVVSVSERIGAVTFTSTNATNNIWITSPNTLILGGNVSCAAGAGIQGRLWADSPSGQITLDGTTRSFTVPDETSQLEIYGNLADGGAAGGLTKLGSGEMILRTVTTFSGPATVAAGTLTLANNQSLGGTAGATTVQTGAVLALGYESEGVTLPAGETIHLAGTLHANDSFTISGPIVLSGIPTISAAAGYTLTRTGVMSGSGAPLNIGGYGTVVMAGTASNTMGGYVSVGVSSNLHLNKTNAVAIPGTVKFETVGGTLKLLAPNQIGDSGSVWMAKGGIFDLNSQNETIGFLFGSTGNGGKVTLGDATLTLNGTTNVQLGNTATPAKASISGTALSKIRKLGSNTWTLYHSQFGSSSTFPTLSVEAGTVELYDEWLGSIEAKGGLLRGHATTGAILGMGGQVCLCDFTTASFSGVAAVRVAINGGTPGTGFDRMICHGAVNLTGQTLQVSLGAFTPMTSGRFTIIDRSVGDGPVTGTFAGLPEGAGFMLNGLPFRITYKGGDYDNDVQLIFLGTGTPGPEITGITKNGNSVAISVSWLPAMSGQRVDIQRAIGPAPNPLSIWGAHGFVILDAQGKGTYTSNVFGTSIFFRLTAN